MGEEAVFMFWEARLGRAANLDLPDCKVMSRNESPNGKSWMRRPVTWETSGACGGVDRTAKFWSIDWIGLGVAVV